MIDRSIFGSKTDTAGRPGLRLDRRGRRRWGGASAPSKLPRGHPTRTGAPPGASPRDPSGARAAPARRGPLDRVARDTPARRLLPAGDRAGRGRARRVAGGPPRSRRCRYASSACPCIASRSTGSGSTGSFDLKAVAARKIDSERGRAGPPLEFSRPELPRARRLGRRHVGLRGASLLARSRDELLHGGSARELEAVTDSEVLRHRSVAATRPYVPTRCASSPSPHL